jgi:multicomponent K+:H+ antiporter subunit G
MNEALPLWAEVLTAVFAVVGAAFAAIGSFGLVRIPTFFRRIHTPTLGATLGVWCMTLATIIYFSVQGRSLFLHAVLIALFVALTAPVTTIFLMRASRRRPRTRCRCCPNCSSNTATSWSSSPACSRARRS